MFIKKHGSCKGTDSETQTTDETQTTEEKKPNIFLVFLASTRERGKSNKHFISSVAGQLKKATEFLSYMLQ